MRPAVAAKWHLKKKVTLLRSTWFWHALPSSGFRQRLLLRQPVVPIHFFLTRRMGQLLFHELSHSIVEKVFASLKPLDGIQASKKIFPAVDVRQTLVRLLVQVVVLRLHKLLKRFHFCGDCLEDILANILFGWSTGLLPFCNPLSTLLKFSLDDLKHTRIGTDGNVVEFVS